MEVYIDDIVVKNKKNEDHLTHLAQTFTFLREYNMKLNMKKCSFGVGSGKFWFTWSVSELSKQTHQR